MTQTEYKQKRSECWEKFKRENLDGEVQWQPVSRYDVFCDAFDRAYALGKQEIKQETKQEKDAEGEVMLTVSRKRVQEMFTECNDDAIQNKLAGYPDYALWELKCDLLKHLFGSECLPDNVATSEPNVDSSVGSVESLDPKPAEPKFRVGDKVKDISSPHDDGIYRVDDIKKSSDGFIYHIQGLIGQSNVKESDLALYYTEPKYHRGEKVRYNGYVYEVEGLVGKNRYALKGLNFDLDEDMIEPYTEPKENIAETRNLSQDRDKLFYNILKNSFSKERRLNIAAQMMQGLICAPLIPGVDPNPSAEYLAQAAFRLADALIAEAEKGGDK